MSDICVKAPAKINLFLEIKGILRNGYHDMDMVMVNIDLFDEIGICFTGSGKIEMPGEESPEKNLVYRAAKKFYEISGIPCPGIELRLKKNIPAGTGMGGGSSDASAVMKALAKHHGYIGDLFEAGLSLGADIPFCLLGAPAAVRGIGEKLEVLPEREIFMVVAVPAQRISTAEAFKAFDGQGQRYARPSDAMMKAFTCGSIHNIAACCHNGMEKTSSLLAPQIGELKRQLVESGALSACMTGSGSAVFGIFESGADAKAAAAKINLPGAEVFCVKTI